MYVRSRFVARLSVLQKLRFVSSDQTRRCHAMAASAAKETLTLDISKASTVSPPRDKNIRGYGDGPKPLPLELQRETQDVDPTSMPKRVVALHIGYVGTNYRGVWCSDLTVGGVRYRSTGLLHQRKPHPQHVTQGCK